ncbi:MAG: hypothetical protein JSW10_05955 [Pseudomonadota bacterium]|nr:MAG: hypothetical protein JSW10_05955 [Pseudomonadota bacterium]
MKTAITATTGALLLLGVHSAYADSITCGTHIVSDDQTQPQTKGEIRQKCGKPKSERGNNLYYEHAGGTYRLHFNDNGELESISRE